MVFKQLPALQELLLDSNPLSDVTGPEDGDFVKLQRFSLSNTGSVSYWCFSLNCMCACVI